MRGFLQKDASEDPMVALKFNDNSLLQNATDRVYAYPAALPVADRAQHLKSAIVGWFTAGAHGAAPVGVVTQGTAQSANDETIFYYARGNGFMDDYEILSGEANLAWAFTYSNEVQEIVWRAAHPGAALPVPFNHRPMAVIACVITKLTAADHDVAHVNFVR